MVPKDSISGAVPDIKRTLVFGLAIALFAGLFWGTFYMGTGDAIMWATLVVGLLVGGTLRSTGRGLSGTSLQVVAVTLVCVAFLVAAYIRFFALYLDFIRDRGGDRAADMIPATLMLEPSFMRAFVFSLPMLTRQDIGWLVAGVAAAVLCVRRKPKAC